MNLIYHEIKEENYQQCAKLFQKCFGQEPWNENWTYEQSYQRLNEIMSSSFAFGYVVCDKSDVIGMLCGRIMTFMDYKELWIDDFCISGDYQGQGLGSLFLNQVKEVLKEKSVSCISLNTTRGFLSDKFYKKNGFIEKETIVYMNCKVPLIDNEENLLNK